MIRAFRLGLRERREPDNPYLSTQPRLRRAYTLGAAVAWRHWEAWAYDGPRERHPILAKLARRGG